MAGRLARAGESYQARTEDMIGEKLVINMGPSHPATHGVLRLVLELDGEIITKADPDVGFLHRGDEKIAENMHYNQFVPYTDRLDYLAPLANNVAYALAVEKLMGWTLPPRGQAMRVICCEMARISSHLLGVGVFRHGCRRHDRFPLHVQGAGEDLQSLRAAHRRAVHHELHARRRNDPRCIRRFVAGLSRSSSLNLPLIDEMDKLLSTNNASSSTARRTSVSSKEEAIAYGLSGPNLRACGVDHDLRKTHPYLGYENTISMCPWPSGDCYDRYLVRMEEIRQRSAS